MQSKLTTLTSRTAACQKLEIQRVRNTVMGEVDLISGRGFPVTAETPIEFPHFFPRFNLIKHYLASTTAQLLF